MKIDSFRAMRIATALGLAGLLSGMTPSFAEDICSGYYLAADAGLNLADNLSARNFSISLDPGFRLDASAGYAFKLSNQFSLAPEFEAGFIYNSFSINSSSGYYMQVPLIANALLNWRFSSGWVAYAGGGVGYNYNYFSDSHIGGFSLGPAANGEFDFAWQAMAGIHYHFGGGEIGLGYKYLAVQPSDWQTVGNNTILISYTFYF